MESRDQSDMPETGPGAWPGPRDAAGDVRPPPPPSRPPTAGPPPPGAPLRAVAAGLLSLSGLGLGHVLVRRRARAAVSWAATAAFLLVALPADPDGVPALLVAAYVVLLVLAGADAARIALRTEFAGWARPVVAAAVGLALLAVPVAATSAYGSARDEAREQELLDRLEEGDELVTKASKNAFVLSGPDYRSALAIYRELGEDHPGSRAAALVPERLRAYYTAVSTPYRAKNYCTAVDPLAFLRTLPERVDRKLLGDLPGRADAPLAESLYACGVSRLNGSGTESGGTELTALLRTFPESAQAGQVAPAVSGKIRQQVADLKGEDPCAVTDGLRRTSNLVAGLPGTSTTALGAQAAAGVRDGVYACGVDEFEDGKFGEARQTLTDFADAYRSDKRRGHAEDIAVAAEIAGVRPAAGKRLPPSGGAGGTRMELVISNDAPNGVEVLYTGPVTGTVKLKPCGSCRRYSSEATGAARACRAGGTSYPKARLRLPAGEYHFLYKHDTGVSTEVDSYASGSKVKPGYSYTSCTYVVERDKYGLDLPSLPDLLKPASLLR